MGTIASIDDLTNKLTGGNNGNPEMPWFFKTDRIDDGVTLGTPPSAGQYSYWRHSGYPTSGATPTTARNPTNATAGALPLTDASGGRTKWLVGMMFAQALGSNGPYFVVDRLADIGGLDGTVTTAQNTTSLAVSRYTNGLGNEIWVEIYTLIGATTRTITATYTDDGNVSRTTDAVTIGNTNFREVGRFIRLPLHPSSNGVKSVQSVILSGTTGTAGNFGVTIVHPIAMLESPVTPGATARNFALFEMPARELQAGAALMLYQYALGVTPTEFNLMPSTLEA